MASNNLAAAALAQHAAAARQIRLQNGRDIGLLQRVNQVKQWQAKRLATTHADLLSSARHGQAAQFFLSDLYGTKDVSRRDAELVRVIPVMQRFLPEPALAVLARAAQLDALSEQLDMQLANQLTSQTEPSSALDQNSYQRAYLAVHQTNETARPQQMDLVIQVGSVLDTLVRKPLLGGLLKTMAPAAHAAGFDAMHDFLSRGFLAFKKMNGAREFLQIIDSRERANHEKLISST
jgi:hypothetical protein